MIRRHFVPSRVGAPFLLGGLGRARARRLVRESTPDDGRTAPGATLEVYRLLAANDAELSRADTKSAVLLGFIGGALGVFITATRGAGSRQPPVRTPDLLWWSTVGTACFAIACFVCAIAPRYRRRRWRRWTGPDYFEPIARHRHGDRLALALQQQERDPSGALVHSLLRTSKIVRAKYRWIERGAALVLITLPQFAWGLQHH